MSPFLFCIPQTLLLLDAFRVGTPRVSESCLLWAGVGSLAQYQPNKIVGAGLRKPIIPLTPLSIRGENMEVVFDYKYLGQVNWTRQQTQHSTKKLNVFYLVF